MIEAMKQALHVMESVRLQVTSRERINKPYGEEWYDEAITSLRKAIQEEALRNVQRIGQEIEQEPVAINWGAVHEKLELVWYRELSADEGLEEIQDLIDTHPPQRIWVGLTDEEAKEIQLRMVYGNHPFLNVINAIEAKLKEKNT